MHIQTNKNALVAQLALVSGAADTRNTLPILGSVLLNTDGNKLSLLCSDTGVLASSLTECEVKAIGSIAVDCRRFNDLVRAIPDKSDLDIKLEEKGTLLVQAGRSRFRLPTFPAKDYPQMGLGEETKVSITLAAKRLGEMIEQVSVAAGVNDVRTFLNGILFCLKDGALHVVATDGHRLTLSREAIAGCEDGSATVNVIVPRKTALLAKKLLACEGDVTLTLCENDITFAFQDKSVVMGKAILGKFPDWQRVIPNNPHHIAVDAPRLREAVGMLEAVVSDGGKKEMAQRGIEIAVDKNVLSLQKGDTGRSEIELSVESEPCQIGVNVDYLRDAIAILGNTERVRCGYNGKTPGQAITIRPGDSEYPLTVVMPMRL